MAHLGVFAKRAHPLLARTPLQWWLHLLVRLSKLSFRLSHHHPLRWARNTIFREGWKPSQCCQTSTCGRFLGLAEGQGIPRWLGSWCLRAAIEEHDQKWLWEVVRGTMEMIKTNLQKAADQSPQSFWVLDQNLPVDSGWWIENFIGLCQYLHTMPPEQLLSTFLVYRPYLFSLPFWLLVEMQPIVAGWKLFTVGFGKSKI